VTGENLIQTVITATAWSSEFEVRLMNSERERAPDTADCRLVAAAAAAYSLQALPPGYPSIDCGTKRFGDSDTGI